MFLTTFKSHFSAAHQLYNARYSEEWNKEVYGPCCNMNWHGHNFDLYVTIKGEVDQTGLSVERSAMEELIHERIIKMVDHKNLNLDVPFMKGKLVSCENMVISFWEIIANSMEKRGFACRLFRIRLYETTRNFVDYYGPN